MVKGADEVHEIGLVLRRLLTRLDHDALVDLPVSHLVKRLPGSLLRLDPGLAEKREDLRHAAVLAPLQDPGLEDALRSFPEGREHRVYSKNQCSLHMFLD